VKLTSSSEADRIPDADASLHPAAAGNSLALTLEEAPVKKAAKTTMLGLVATAFAVVGSGAGSAHATDASDPLGLGLLKSGVVGFENNSLLPPVAAACGPLASNANCDTSYVGNHSVGSGKQMDSNLIGTGRS
jgi:hypothetical protein